MYIYKADITEYKEKQRNLGEVDGVELKYKSLYDKSIYIEEIEDLPNEKEEENKNHLVWYKVEIYGKDGLSYRMINYDQTIIGISTSEVFIIILSIICYMASAFFILRGIIIMCRKNKNLEEVIKDSNLTELLD